MSRGSSEALEPEGLSERKARHTVPVQVTLRNPRRTVVIPGPVRVSALLAKLEINRESVLVIRNDTLVPGDGMLRDEDEVEIRPVISGGHGVGRSGEK